MGELYNPYPKLPKNIRQIGDKDENVKLYLEDYVNTYLKRLYPIGGQDLRIGLLLGTVELYDGTPYVFIDGAIEMEDVSADGEKVVFSEAAWKKVYQEMEETFPKRTVQGWFLCGAPGCQLSPLNYWKQHSQYFTGKNQLMYLNGGLEGEESVYIASEDGFYKLKGHSIYYERNQMMQDYMVLRKEAGRVETGASDQITRDFRRKLEDRKIEMTGRRNTIGLLSAVCSALSVVVLAGGIVMFNNYNKMKEMESALVSVLPQGAEGWIESKGKEKMKEEDSVIIEEMPGRVYPTEETMEETIQEQTVGRPGSGYAADGETIAQEQTTGIPPESAQSGNTGAGSKVVAETVAPPQTSGQAQETPAGNQAQSPPQSQAQSNTAQPTVENQDNTAQGGNATAGQNYDESVSAASGNVYIVGDGETLYGICLKTYHNLKRLDEVCKLNNIDDVNKLISGQKLILP